MSNPKKYFHDRFVLLMLTINVFLAIVCVAMVLLRLGDTSNSYIESYRSNLGLSSYRGGNAGDIIAFAVFAVVVVIGQFYISLQLHMVRKHASWTVMLLGGLLLVLALIVSNALLQLH